MKHLISALVQNVPGVLSHVSGMLAARGYNIESLAVGETEDPKISRMTFVVVGDTYILSQVRADLHTNFSRGRTGGLVFSSLEEFSSLL